MKKSNKKKRKKQLNFIKINLLVNIKNDLFNYIFNYFGYIIS